MGTRSTRDLSTCDVETGDFRPKIAVYLETLQDMPWFTDGKS